MALSTDDVQDIINRYDRGNGETVAALAEAFKVSDSAIKYHLKKHGILASDGQKPETDADLGIGDDDEPDFTKFMENPALQRLIDAAVAARLGQMRVPDATSAPAADFKALADSLAHMIEVSQAQQPGYIKPLPAHVIDERAAAYVEMLALLKKYSDEGVAPEYTLTADLIETSESFTYKAGSKIQLLIAPPEMAIPENAAAEAVYGAMLRWIGGPTPGIGEQIETAQRESRIPMIGALGVAKAPERQKMVKVLSEPTPEPNGRKKRLGPGMTEVQHAHSGAPVGPAYSERAA